MKILDLEIKIEKFPIKGTFTIARGAKTEAVVVTATIKHCQFTGRGECVPYGHYGETPESVVAQIEQLRPRTQRGLTKSELQTLIAPGAARNAVDCALWDLEAKETGTPAHMRAGLTAWKPVTTAYTISLASAEEMAAKAREASSRPILKIKLGAKDGDIQRIQAVRAAVPDAILIADANEGWTPQNAGEHFEACANARYALIEQPLPSAQDELLRNINKPVPLCADESLHDRGGLQRLKGIYNYINVKLDKAGGLTEALALAQAAMSTGFGIMVGCMVATSLATAPAMLIAMEAEFVDLDGPLLLAKDRDAGLKYEGSKVFPPAPDLWG